MSRFVYYYYSGKIPYSPHTPLVKSIIKEANVTFESIEFIRSVGETWRSTTGPALYRNLESGNVTTFLRVRFKDRLRFERSDKILTQHLL